LRGVFEAGERVKRERREGEGKEKRDGNDGYKFLATALHLWTIA